MSGTTRVCLMMMTRAKIVNGNAAPVPPQSASVSLIRHSSYLRVEKICVNPLPLLRENHYSWSQVAMIIILIQGQGVQYSQGKTCHDYFFIFRWGGGGGVRYQNKLATQFSKEGDTYHNSTLMSNCEIWNRSIVNLWSFDPLVINFMIADSRLFGWSYNKSLQPRL